MSISLGMFLEKTVPIYSRMTKILDKISPFFNAALLADRYLQLKLSCQ